MEDQEMTTLVLPTLDTFLNDKWEMTKGITGPYFSTVWELYPNQEFQVIIILGRYEIVDKKINIKISCQIEDANGNVVIPQVFKRQLQADDLEGEIGMILMPELPKFSFGPEHNEGEYYIVVRRNDENTDEEEEIIKRKITFSKKSPSQFNELDGTLEEWRQNYYLDPKPTELISSYFKSMEEIGINNDANILFYVEAFNNALFLVDDVNQLLLKGEISRMERNALIMLMARSKYEDVDLEGFWKEELEVLHEIRDEGVYNPLYVEQIGHPRGLDMLWSLFFANGKYENIEKIISVLNYKKGKDLESIKSLGEEEQIQFAFGMASAWSLGEHGMDHPMVKVYIQYTLNRPDISDYLKEELTSILSEIDEAEEIEE
ncbi:hypothetical protein FUAX_41250 (plasmid) [Fulvitalea axinellae]|uniref:DUF4365 domain-containing protein n=1 Tax=Fulvitalea axinellae TaxID=1182444 RepID=A0AAU9D6Q8_9BACT|nr:hypothetical protein FUAX_41250 [Fulvitalea axinellae]